MKNHVVAWLLVSQTIHAVACLTWFGIVRHTIENLSPNLGDVPRSALVFAALYPLVIISLCATAWLRLARHEDAPATIITTVPLVLTLPVIAYGLVNFLATR